MLGEQRRCAAGLGEEGDAGEVEGGVEDVAAAVDDGPAEDLVEEMLLCELPAEPLALGLGGDGWSAGIGVARVGADGLVRSLGGGVGDAVGVEGGGLRRLREFRVRQVTFVCVSRNLSRHRGLWGSRAWGPGGGCVWGLEVEVLGDAVF